MGFNLEDYEPVAARLARWLDTASGVDQPRVITHLVHYQENRCVFRAELWLGDVLISTGWAEETRGDGNVNRTSHLENCESSAVGRALANAGLAGSDPSKRPSREEMAKVSRAGGGTPSASSSGSNYPSLASDKQMDALRKMGKRRGHADDEALAEALTLLCGKTIGLLTMSRADASFAIGEWTKDSQ
jgi:hypothetical protein